MKKYGGKIMKIKSIVFAMILCLVSAFFMTACFDDPGNDQSGTSTGSESVSESLVAHEHVYKAVEEVSSTCVKAGVKSHYKCDCGKLFVKDGDEYVETTQADLALPLAAHSFNGITVKTNPTKIVYTAFEQFDLTGIEVVKTCSVAGCDGEEVASGEVAFDYEKDGATNLTADMTKVVIKAANFETELSVTVNKIVVKLPVIESKEYTGAVLTAVVPESALYTVTENNGGTDIGEYDVKLTLTDAVNYAFEGVDGEVATVKFKITKTANEIIMPEIISEIKCHGEPIVDATAKENATITYVYASEENGEYGAKPEGGFVAGTYYVKAVAAETENYKETVSAPKSFVVKHAVASWNTDGEDADIGVCVCGAELPDVTFGKVVSGGAQDVILSAETKTITLGGISGYKAVKSVKYGELDLGNDISDLVIPEGMNEAAHGAQTLTVVVTDNYDLDHTISVPVVLVTKSVTTFDELTACVTYKAERGTTAEGEDKYNEGKYFILANDITVTGSYSASGIQWANAGRGFAGTLDGRGHSLIGGNMYGGGLFGSIESGTVKNIKFEKVNAVGANRTLIAGTLFNATLENVEIYITDKLSVTVGSFWGVLATHPVNNVTLTNVKIDATGSSLPWIVGHHSNNADPARYHCTNVEIIADSVDCFSSGNAGKLYLDEVEGVSFKLGGNIDATETADPIDPKQFGSSFEYIYTFEGVWARYTTLKSVMLGETDVTDVVDLLENTLAFGDLTDYITEDVFNKTVTFVVEFDAGENNSVKVALNLSVLDRNEKVELTTRQDVIMKDAAGEYTTFTLDLGEDLADATVTGALFNEESLTVTDGAITFSDSMINGVHGEHVLTVFAAKGNTNYNITAPVTIVTESISAIDRLKEVVGYKDGTTGKTCEGKYYILAGDITHTSSYSGNITQTGIGNGFAGTLDGRGHSLIGGNFYGGGLFGSIDGGTIKNLKFSGVNPVGANRTLIAGSIYNATLENIEIKTYKVEISDPGSYFGVISSHRAVNVTMKDVTIDMTGSTLPWIFGKGWGNAGASNYKCENVEIKVKSLGALAANSNDSSLLANDGVSGLTVTIAE